MKERYRLLILSLVSLPLSIAQTGHLTGLVTAKDPVCVVEGTTINLRQTIDDTLANAVAGKDGKADFGDISTGPYKGLAVDASLRCHAAAKTTVYPNNQGNTVKPDPVPLSTSASIGRVYFVLVRFPGNDVASDVPGPDVPQLPGEMRGSVVDQSGKGIAGVRISLLGFSATAEPSGAPAATTDDDGTFSIPMPADGVYFLKFRPKLFRGGAAPSTYFVRVKDGIATVLTDDGGPADIGALHLGATSSMAAPTIETAPQTAESTRRLSLEAALISALPLRGIRNPDDLALLAPGVAPTAQTPVDTGPGIAPGLGTAGQFAVNGLRSRDNNFTVDGQDDRDDLVGVRREGFFASTSVPADAIEEFQILTVLGDSQSARTIGPQINSLSQHAPSRYHGSLYGLFTSDALRSGSIFDQNVRAYPSSAQQYVPITSDGTLSGTPVLLTLPAGYTGPLVARNGYAVTANPLRGKNNLIDGQEGLKLSGPITRHLSGLFTAEGQSTSANQRRDFIVPTYAQRGWFGTAATGFHSNVVEGPTAPNISVPVYPVSLPGDAIFSLIPYPNNPLGPYGPNTFTQSLPAGGMARMWEGKLDLSLPPAITASARYNRVDDWADIPAEGGGIYSAMRPLTKIDSLAGFFNFHHPDFKPLFVEARVSWGRSSINFDELRDPSLLQSGIRKEPFLLNAPLLINNTSPDTPASPSLAPAPNVSPDLFAGLNTTEQLTGPLGQLMIAGFSPVGVDPYHFPQSRTDSTFQIGETATYLTSRQTTLAGFDAYFLRLSQFTDRGSRPQAIFGGMVGCCYSQSNITNNPTPVDGALFDPLSLAAAGVPLALNETLYREPENALGLNRLEIGIFAHHYQRLGSRLEVNFGGRIDVASLPKNQSSRFDEYYYSNNPDTTIASDVNDALAKCGLLASAASFSSTCSQIANGLNVSLPTPLKNALDVSRPYFDFRGGLAWDISADGRTVLRGGAGTYHGQFPAIIVDESRSTLPNYVPLNIANAPGLNSNQLPVLYNIAGNFLPGTFGPVIQSNTLNLLANSTENIVSLIAADLANANPILLQTGADPSIRGPWALNAAMMLEHQFAPGFLVSAAYVGTQGRNLLRLTAPDQPPGIQRLSLNNNIYPLTGTLLPNIDGSLMTSQRYLATIFTSQAYSTYHSLQTEFRGSFHRLLFGASFTLSKAVDNSSDFFDLSGAPALADNSANRSETGPSNYDTRARAAGYFVWDVPGKKRRIFEGWRLSGIVSGQTGQPYTVNSIYDANGDGNLTDRPVVSPAVVRQGNRLALAPSGDMAGILGIANGLQTGQPIGRNTLRMPAWSSVDLAAMKSIPLPHGMFLTPRVEIFNWFNSVRYEIPDRWLGSSAFGLSGGSLLQPRTAQLVIRFDF